MRLSVEEYQALAARTIDKGMNNEQMLLHALHGMSSEIGEIHGIYQKRYQGHKIGADRVREETGDLLWFVAEFCTANGWNMAEIMSENIEKLKNRYPDGFEPERSVHRQIIKCRETGGECEKCTAGNCKNREYVEA